jgi:glyoxylase-like metal-dependent hydrolase (beta-lactamase superfamily II)
MAPPWLHFIERPFPSANMVLIAGPRPVLVDPGFGSDRAATADLLRGAGIPPERLALIVNTHYHSDHIGGNYALQHTYGLPVAAHAAEAAQVNARDPQTGMAVWLDQPIEPYTVQQPLHDGAEIDTGAVRLRVVHTPGHTRGHITLYAPAEQILIAGDALHAADVPWINRFGEGADALEQALATLDRLAALPLRWACSGHGPAITDPAAAIAKTRRRYTQWQQAPEQLAWHACKRIFAYALMIRDGLPEAEVRPYLLNRSWFADYSRHVFGVEPAAFVERFLAEILRVGAGVWQDRRLVARTPHIPPPPGWIAAPARPQDWPAVPSPALLDSTNRKHL